MTVTVVICTRNRPALLEKCLAGVQRLSPPPDKVHVIDNSEGDPETERVTRLFGARYVVEPTPGVKHAMKRALVERETDLIAFLRDNVIPAENWLTSLLPDIPEDDPGDPAGEKIMPVPPVIH